MQQLRDMLFAPWAPKIADRDLPRTAHVTIELLPRR
jgi:hypothetical protein